MRVSDLFGGKHRITFFALLFFSSFQSRRFWIHIASDIACLEKMKIERSFSFLALSLFSTLPASALLPLKENFA